MSLRHRSSSGESRGPSIRERALPALPWLIHLRWRGRSVIAAVYLAALFTGIALSAGRGVRYSSLVLLACLVVGVVPAAAVEAQKRWMLAPRPPHGVSRWRTTQLTRACVVPEDPGEQDALRRALRPSGGRLREVVAAGRWVVLALVLIGLPVLAALVGPRWLVVFSCVMFPALLVVVVLDERRRHRERRYLLARLPATSDDGGASGGGSLPGTGAP